MGYAIRVDGSEAVRLDRIDPGQDGGLTKEQGLAALEALGQEFSKLEDLLFYAGHHALLIILQGRDTSGKDGTIRRILQFSNAQSVRVVPFKAPTAEELAHDFLWRIHAHTPARGSAAIFNRSHYEDVLVPRVHKLTPRKEWEKRFRHIKHFEELLLDHDTLVLKFFLHISREEQEARLLAREQEPEKAWKLNVGDWEERKLWDDYTAAYEDILHRCATPAAPWFVIPGDRKWFRDLAVLEQVVEALRPHREAWMEKLRNLGKTARAELEAYRASSLKSGGSDEAGRGKGG